MSKFHAMVEDMKKNQKSSFNKFVNKSLLVTVKPKETVTVRILPYKEQKDLPILPLQVHYGINTLVVSPRSYGEPDPIADFADELRPNASAEDKALADKLTPSTRWFVPVIVRGKEEEGCKFWGFGAEILEKLFTKCSNPEYGDVSNLKTGTDLTLVKLEPKGKQAAHMGKIDLDFARKESYALANTEMLKKILHEQPSIYDAFIKPTYEELTDLLASFLNAGSKGDTSIDDLVDETKADTPPARNRAPESDAPIVPKVPKDVPKPRENVQVTSDTDDFDALFDED